jgi:hypothetical protein
MSYRQPGWGKMNKYGKEGDSSTIPASYFSCFASEVRVKISSTKPKAFASAALK